MRLEKVLVDDTGFILYFFVKVSENFRENIDTEQRKW